MGHKYKLYGSKGRSGRRNKVTLSKGRVLEVGGDAVELEDNEVEVLRDKHNLEIRKMPDTNSENDNEDDES